MRSINAASASTMNRVGPRNGNGVYLAPDGYVYTSYQETRDDLRATVAPKDRSCTTAVLAPKNGQPQTAIMCMMPNGSWQIVSVQ